MIKSASNVIRQDILRIGVLELPEMRIFSPLLRDNNEHRKGSEGFVDEPNKAEKCRGPIMRRDEGHLISKSGPLKVE